MSWRHQGITGSNNIPLGRSRRFGGGDDADEQREPSNNGASHFESSSVGGERDAKRGRSPERNEDGTRRRKKRNRWGDATENKAAGLMGLPTAIQANMTSEQIEAYTLHLRIEEITQKLKIDDVVPADGDRSLSPAPQYDNHGRRINTREYRYRKKLEDERHKLVERAMKTIPNYHPPSDYRRPTKTQEKVYVPVNDYPEINFIGLLIGPRGNTLKKMETESGAKIAIRGKGSVKEGKGRSDAAHSSNQEEDLHCLIMADTEEKVNKAKKLIHNVIETAASIPEGQNELKRNQLRELAALNGTLRDDENQACQNCGNIGHRKYDCPERQNYTASIICRCCGNAGHMARDCPDRQRGTSWRNDGNGPNRSAGRIGGPGGDNGGDVLDREYNQLMQELGGGGGPVARIEAGPGSGNVGGNNSNGNGDSRPPWQRGPAGPAPWRMRNNDRDNDGNGGPPSGPGGGVAPWHRDRQARMERDGDRDGDRDRRRPDRDSHYGGANGGQGFGGAPGTNSAPGMGSALPPWQQQAAPGTAPSFPGFPGFPGFGAPMAPGLAPGLPGIPGAPPGAPGLGLPPPPLPGMGAPGLPPMPPGTGASSAALAGNISALIQQYANAAPPPPPPGSAPPPPPPGDAPPPPPPGDAPPPPPPSDLPPPPPPPGL